MGDQPYFALGGCRPDDTMLHHNINAKPERRSLSAEEDGGVFLLGWSINVVTHYIDR